MKEDFIVKEEYTNEICKTNEEIWALQMEQSDRIKECYFTGDLPQKQFYEFSCEFLSRMIELCEKQKEIAEKVLKENN